MKNDIRYIHFDSIDSTNTEARRHICVGKVSSPTLIVADTQTAGRGRLGRSFYSPDKTGLYMSLVLESDSIRQPAVRATTAAAVAVHRHILEVYGILTQIKWVNDLYLDGKKVCGILCESAEDGDGNRYIIIGIGVNLSTHQFPDGLRAPAGCILPDTDTLDGDGKRRMAIDISNRIIDTMQGEDNSSDLDIYRKHSYLDGKRVVCDVGDRSFYGTAVGIGDDFSLTVMTDSGEEVSLCSGEASIKVKNGEE